MVKARKNGPTADSHDGELTVVPPSLHLAIFISMIPTMIPLMQRLFISCAFITELRRPDPFPTSLKAINQWPTTLLDRCEALWGKDQVVRKLRTLPACLIHGLISMLK